MDLYTRRYDQDLHFAVKAEHVGEPDVNPTNVLEHGGAFQWFLINIDGVKQKNPEKNSKYLVKAATRFSEGAGLTYARTHPLHNKRIFGAGISCKTLSVFMRTDFHAIRSDANRFLHDMPDTTKGWNFTYPLRKLFLFKQYLRLRIKQRKPANHVLSSGSSHTDPENLD